MQPALIIRNTSENDISSSINTSQEFSPYGVVIDVLQNGLSPISRKKSHTVFKKHEYGNLGDFKVPDKLWERCFRRHPVNGSWDPTDQNAIENKCKANLIIV